MADFNKELWLNDLAANLYSNNEFFRIGKNWSDKVLGAIVHIPQALATSVPQKVTTGTSLPIAAAAATYDDLTFPNEMIVMPPIYNIKIEQAQASFNSRSTLLEDRVSYLKQAIEMEIMQAWNTVATSSILRTTGVSTRANIYGQAAMKSLTMFDILTARAQIIRQNANVNNLYLIVDPIMYNDLVQLDEFTKADALVISTAVEGFVGVIAGMKVIQRSLGNPVTSLLAKPAAVDYTDGYDATHYSAALIIDAGKVGYALGTLDNGEIQIGFENYATGYYTDIMQAHTRVGASRMFKEVSNITKGVVAIIETA